MVSTTSTAQEVLELLSRTETLILQQERDFQQEEGEFRGLLVKIVETVIGVLKPILRYIDNPLSKKYNLLPSAGNLRGVILSEAQGYILLRSGAICYMKPTDSYGERIHEPIETIPMNIPEFLLTGLLSSMLNVLRSAIQRMDERREAMQNRRQELARVLSEFQLQIVP